MNNVKFITSALLVAFIFIGLLTFVQADTDVKQSAEKRTIDVSGSATLGSNPDKAEIYVGVYKEDSEASAAQKYVTEKMNAVRNALQAKGVKLADIETTEYSLTPLYDYDYKAGSSKRIFKGYRASHSVKVSTTDTANVGALIDVAIDSGANEVNSVQFTLTDAKIEELRLKAYKEAAISSKKKASAIAEGLGVKLGDVISVTDGSPVVIPYYSRVASAQLYEGGAAPAQTQIDVGQVKISVDLRATFLMQ